MYFQKRGERFSFSLGEKAGMRAVVPPTSSTTIFAEVSYAFIAG